MCYKCSVGASEKATNVARGVRGCSRGGAERLRRMPIADRMLEIGRTCSTGRRMRRGCCAGRGSWGRAWSGLRRLGCGG